MSRGQSKSVTVVGVLLMLVGGFSAGMAVVSVIAGERQMDRVITLINQQLDLIPTGTQPNQAPPEQVAEIRREIDQRLTRLRELLRSRSMRTGYLIQAVLGMALCCGGIGLWQRWAWSAPLITSQAVLAVGFGCWWLLASPLRAYQRELVDLVLSLMARITIPSARVQFQRTVQMSQTVGQWFGLLMAIGWNGFLIWFVRRAAVQTELRPAADGS